MYKRQGKGCLRTQSTCQKECAKSTHFCVPSLRLSLIHISISTGGALAETLGKVQPFRYRGYVFDEEPGLYYLRSRYYNPRWGRFVNADVILFQEKTSGKHNPVSYTHLINYATIVFAAYSGNSVFEKWLTQGKSVDAAGDTAEK